MKLSTFLFASVLGATVFAAAGTASADRYVRYGYHDRVIVRPAVRPWRFYGPRVVIEPTYVAPVVVERPAVVVRPAPVIVRPRYWRAPVVVRGGYRRW